jgi:hypothetical protein
MDISNSFIFGSIIYLPDIPRFRHKILLSHHPKLSNFKPKERQRSWIFREYTIRLRRYIVKMRSWKAILALALVIKLVVAEEEAMNVGEGEASHQLKNTIDKSWADSPKPATDRKSSAENRFIKPAPETKEWTKSPHHPPSKPPPAESEKKKGGQR